MNTHYSSEKGIQILIALLKAHNIKKVISSPGTTNMMLNASLMYDGSFEIFSSVDERSAAYMACGMAYESGEPVVLTCTGATASRNYFPGLTEAYYRKLPIIAVTGTQDLRRLGNLYDQVIDRSTHPKDTVIYSTYIPYVKDKIDEETAALKINQAISALTCNGGGPVHINLETYYNRDLSITELPNVKIIKRVSQDDTIYPSLPQGKIAIFIGSHKYFSPKEVENIDQFCSNHNAVVFCDHTSGYYGKFHQIDALLTAKNAVCLNNIRLLIHIGEISGDHFNMASNAQEIWRISEDGQMRDRFNKLTYLFDMSENNFFKYYRNIDKAPGTSNLETCKLEYKKIYENLPEFPFSNIWIAKNLAPKLPQNSTLHLGILTSLRSWNFFELPHGTKSASNVGGFGTDGSLSAVIGASLINPNNLYFCVLGDLAFFYDINSLGNRHIGKNLRILLVNNGKGCEFTHYLNPGHIFGQDVNPFIAASGHFGNQSKHLVKDFAKNLGFKYITASTKEEFIKQIDTFTSSSVSESYIFEVFTHDYDENEALKLITSNPDTRSLKEKIKNKFSNLF